MSWRLICIDGWGIVFTGVWPGTITVPTEIQTKMLMVRLTWRGTNADMRKPLKRDKLKESVRENGESFIISADDIVF
jgi:hypothetical protein